MTTGERIQAARKRAGYTQSRLAELSGVPIGTIRQYEINRCQPKIKTLQSIANALGVHLIELIEDSPTPELANSGNKGRLNIAFDKLNDSGQQVAVERVEELTYIPKYRTPPQDENED